MNTPNTHSADLIKDWDCQTGIERGDGTRFWVLSRPYGLQGFNLKKRISCAWLVFTGKADALVWHPKS